MNNYSDDGMRAKPDEATIDELSHLVDAGFDDVISDEQQVRLNELLGRNVAVRRYYLRYIAIHSALKTSAGNQAGRKIEELRQQLERGGRVLSSATTATTHRKFPDSSLLRAAVILFILAPIALYLARRPEKVQEAAQRAPSKSPSSASVDRIEGIALIDSATSSPLPGVVKVSRISSKTRWSHPNESFAIDSTVRTGDRLRVLNGEVELLYETGVKVILIGPVDFVLRDAGGTLRRGGLMASVPQAGHGFTINTPNGKVVDLGTEFGVMVDDFGVSEVSVFKGNVEAFPSNSNAARDGKIQLSEGSALQWNMEMVKSLEADPRRLPVSLASYTRPSARRAFASESVPMELVGDKVEPEFWSSLGETHTSSEGLVLDGSASGREVPYLISKEQYDPALGPLTIVCDIRFPKLAPQDIPTFAILTRSANDRTLMNRLWSDILSTCVRCNFRSANNESDGVLDTSTKYERDRELTSISWGGFRRPQENVTYRLVMRDDGVNVSFSVSKREQQLIAKTVTCRSLFQGYMNHIALEGWKNGLVIINNVQIHQSTSDDQRPDRHVRFDVPDASTAPVGQTSVVNELAKRVPSKAKLVIKDDFNTPQLNEDLWSVLGDVNLSGGAISLGEPNNPDHIDTFHPRPYLLSRKEFAPADAAVFVLGRIEFDDNYLNGYGGSFAVMSRCAGQYGDGPEWAVSALSTGIRCNLWPAAPRADHNLEIHEKANSNSLRFLKGSNLKIDRPSRGYFFLLEDSGDRASITFQNASDLSICKTIQCETTVAAPRTGFIGFESCWGSKVLLDDIHIFVDSSMSRTVDNASIREQ